MTVIDQITLNFINFITIISVKYTQLIDSVVWERHKGIVKSWKIVCGRKTVRQLIYLTFHIKCMNKFMKQYIFVRAIFLSAKKGKLELSLSYRPGYPDNEKNA